MAGNITVTSAGSSGTTTLQSTETTDRTLSLPNKTDTLITRTLDAGTNSIAPLNYVSGTNLTTAAAGATEFDGTCFYSTPVASARGLSPSTMFSIVPAGDFVLQTAAGVQSAFPATGDVWTLAATTSYFMEGFYQITKTTGSITTALAFAAAGSLTVTSINYFVWAMNVAVNTTTATVAMTNINQIASTVINAAATTALSIYFKGIIRINVGGTLTPQINFSNTATVPVMKADSYIMFTPIGTNTTNVLGNVA